jgi:hypothetical protein
MHVVSSGTRGTPRHAGMQRRITNTSRYNWNSRKLTWRVDWSFPAAQDGSGLVVTGEGPPGGHACCGG